MLKNLRRQNRLENKSKKDVDEKSFYDQLTDEGEAILRDLGIVAPDGNMSDAGYRFETTAVRRASFAAPSWPEVRSTIPAPDYHLEITAPDEGEARMLLRSLRRSALRRKRSNGRKASSVYQKRADRRLSEYVGASNALFAEDIRIKKDLSNYVNRIMNCDVANEQKAIATAAKQLEHIEFLEKHYGFVNLTPRLIDAIILRTHYPDDSLSQLSEKSVETVNRYISKSGLSHCFRDIERLVEK